MRAFLVAVAFLGCGRGAKTTTSAVPLDAGWRAADGTCGGMGCTQYGTPGDAFAAVVASGPLVLAVGEAHAPRDAAVPSAAKRFAEDLLPAIAPHASDLLVELMMPPPGCAGTTEEVKEKQAVVTTRQAKADQNEYLVMGDRARSLGVVPDMLRPSCSDLDHVRAAGDDAIGASLQLIARLTREQGSRLVRRDATSDADAGKMVVIYGGLLHNDLAPAGDAVDWSYAPALDEAVRGRLVALDLVVPEFITDDASWQSLAWRPYYDKARLGAKATLFRTGERSYVLVFPLTRVTDAAAP